MTAINADNLTITVRDIRPWLPIGEIDEASWLTYLGEVKQELTATYPGAVVEVCENRPGSIRAECQISGIEDNDEDGGDVGTDQAIREEIDATREYVWERGSFWSGQDNAEAGRPSCPGRSAGKSGTDDGETGEATMTTLTVGDYTVTRIALDAPFAEVIITSAAGGRWSVNTQYGVVTPDAPANVTADLVAAGRQYQREAAASPARNHRAIEAEPVDEMRDCRQWTPANGCPLHGELCNPDYR